MRKIVAHASFLYLCLEEASSIDPLTDRLTFKGNLTPMYDKARISRSVGPSVVKILHEAGCIEYQQRGNRDSETVIVLFHEPVEEMLSAGLTKPDRLAMLEQRVENTERAIGGGNIWEALQTLERRMDALEKSFADSLDKPQHP